MALLSSHRTYTRKEMERAFGMGAHFQANIGEVESVHYMASLQELKDEWFKKTFDE